AVGADLERQAFAEPEKRIAGEPLRAFDAFEQETRLERRELDVRRYRRVQVGRDVERGLHAELSIFGLPKQKNPSPVLRRRVLLGIWRRTDWSGPSSGLPLGT